MAPQFLCRTTVNLVQGDSQSGLSKSFRHNYIGHLEVNYNFKIKLSTLIVQLISLRQPNRDIEGRNNKGRIMFMFVFFFCMFSLSDLLLVHLFIK